MTTSAKSFPPLGLLQFQEAYFERLWGGGKLRTALGRNTPPGKIIGEAWLISDHATHESVVSQGEHAGKTLRELINIYGEELLGSKAALTPYGRFPLLLKLLDSGQALSVQVHPDDPTAHALGEPDVGKTEMWHVMRADPGSALICGLDRALDALHCAEAIQNGSIEQYMHRVPAAPGVSVFVPAGTVHAIGGGILLAEIQQNSDLTYRLYDWGRVDDSGKPRALHVEKALKSIHFGSAHGGAAKALSYTAEGGEYAVQAACRYFAAERVTFAQEWRPKITGESFHILLVLDGPVEISAEGQPCTLSEGGAVLVPGGARDVRLNGPGTVLHYYVPDLERDIAAPLRRAGHDEQAIQNLGLNA